MKKITKVGWVGMFNDTIITLDDINCPSWLRGLLLRFHGGNAPEVFMEHEACHMGEYETCILCCIGY